MRPIGSHSFVADEGARTRLEVVGFEQGNPLTTDMRERPAIDFRMRVVRDAARP